ncbi:hypothetical protein [uncultured Cohaesibacter sp.]|uniref:hypothetical protein n=1 Tax=uncultured Cohaesibacter sp. TaxID=1002546 RepID=UPI002AAA8DBF|nr:hypothetical protein [uncultured Cohaesibacter sp.]
MSLTDNITDLVDESRALIETFNAKKDDIDAAVARLEAAETMVTKWVYVDSVNGDDEGLGTAEEPYLTVEKAIDATKDNIRVLVLLLNDAVMTDRVTTGARALLFQGRNAAGETVRRTLSFAAEAVTSPRWSGQRQCAGIEFSASGMVTFTSIDIVIPDCGEEITFPYLVHGGQSGELILRDCDVSIAAAGGVALLLSTYYPAPAALWASNVVLGTGVEGHLMRGVAAGVDPNTDTSNRFRSNLTSV